ncbi:Acyl-CoA dehydrogenase [Paraconexibacter sp. AEG42_29]|uniref:Acyl-CoA dehydrogenase n=1 Tax=Paraconexibacter sp. AEG42_29 TaxID=2997339 RepID=A0AAU7B0A0_9ACTN
MSTAAPSTTPAFELDADHADFREVCHAFVRRELVPLAAQAERDGFPPELWPKLAAAGLLGVGHPEAHGGTGGGVLALAILSEALAHASGGLAITPLVSAYMAAPHLARFGTDDQRERFLAPVLRGESVAAIAVTEPGAGSDVAGMAASARRDGEDWVISGTKMFITNAGYADTIIVGARTDPESRHGGITTFIVDAGTPGLTLGVPLEKMGWHASDTREVVLDGVTVGPDRVLGTVGRGFQQIMEAFEVERITLAGMGVGLAQACLDDALEHAREREAFGRPIGRNQAISHRLGEMATDIAAARLITHQAAARCDSGHPEASASVAMAKLLAARVANTVADHAVQVFGGYGFIEETRVAMHYRDARILRIGGGTDEVQLEILAKRMGL